MAPKLKSERKKKAKRQPEVDIFVAARNYELASKAVAVANKTKKEAQDLMVEQIQGVRKLGSMESAEYGPFTRITVVQNESMDYDEDGLYGDLTAAQRREAYDYSIDLSRLTADERKALNAAMIELLTPAQRKACKVRALNIDRLSQAVQDDKIDPKVIAKHSKLVKSAAYVRISHGSGS